MRIEYFAIALYLLWLIPEAVFLRPAHDRSGSNVDRRSMMLLGSSNMLLPLVSIAVYFAGIGAIALPPAVQIVGIAMMLAGFATRWAGMWTLRRFFSANVAVQSDHRLIVRGPYRFVRHPGYFGGWLAFAGFGIALSNAIAIVLLGLCTVPAFLYRISVEERALRGAFADYTDYSRRVSRFLPFVW